MQQQSRRIVNGDFINYILSNPNKDLITDIKELQKKYGFDKMVQNMDPNTIIEFIRFRYAFLQEELDEGLNALKIKEYDEVVDSLIDIIVVALGTLILLGVDVNTAWTLVQNANMSKVIGQKESRKNSFNFPDLIKPSDWVSPSHVGNIGIMSKIK